jgi:hypothetical protein
MSMGQVQSVLVCQSSSVSDSTGLCPMGKSLVVQEAYVLVPDAGSYLDNFEKTINSDEFGTYFASGFALVMGFYVLAKKFGLIMRVLK